MNSQGSRRSAQEEKKKKKKVAPSSEGFWPNASGEIKGMTTRKIENQKEKAFRGKKKGADNSTLSKKCISAPQKGTRFSEGVRMGGSVWDSRGKGASSSNAERRYTSASGEKRRRDFVWSGQWKGGDGMSWEEKNLA